MKPVKRNILLNPGPATTTDTVKCAQVVPDICPREKEFASVLREIRADLARVVNGGAEYATVLFAGSGTAVMDAVVNSVVPADRSIAVVVNGVYGERMVKIAGAYGIPCVEISHHWGERVDIDRLRRALAEDRSVACLAVVHHETSTGILNPIEEIGRIARENGLVFIVDAISSYAGIPLDIGLCNADFLMATSNKCIQGMPGIAFAICRRRELERIGGYPRRSFYLSLYDQYEHLERTGQTPFTPPVQVAYALRQAIKEYFEEGGHERHARYRENCSILKKRLTDLGFKVLLGEEDESGILLTVVEPTSEDYSFESLHDFLYERGITIYPGRLGDKRTFRIATMGAIYPRDMETFMSHLLEFVATRKIKVEYP